MLIWFCEKNIQNVHMKCMSFHCTIAYELEGVEIKTKLVWIGRMCDLHLRYSTGARWVARQASYLHLVSVHSKTTVTQPLELWQVAADSGTCTELLMNSRRKTSRRVRRDEKSRQMIDPPLPFHLSGSFRFKKSVTFFWELWGGESFWNDISMEPSPEIGWSNSSSISSYTMPVTFHSAKKTDQTIICMEIQLCTLSLSLSLSLLCLVNSWEFLYTRILKICRLTFSVTWNMASPLTTILAAEYSYPRIEIKS
jgi:hypothetical protein